MSATIKNTAFYAVVEPGTGRIVRLRQGLPNQLDTVLPLGGNSMLFSGQNSDECRIAVLPCSPDGIDRLGLSAICRLLGGMELDDMDMPVAGIVTLDEITAPGVLARFIEFCRRSAEERTISFVSDMPFRQLLNEETGDDGRKSVNIDREMRDVVLSVVPGHPLAWEDGWIGDLRRIYHANDAYAHKDLTPHRVDMALAGMGAAEWRDALADDPQVRYYADMVTKYMLKRHPSDVLIKESRTSYENIFGEETQESKQE